MNEFVCLVAVVVGAILVGFGNDLGLLGFIPGTLLMLSEDVKSNN